MAVLDHEVHEKVKIDNSFRYGCWNHKPYQEGYRAPNRYQTSDGYQAVFKTEAKFIPHVMSRECRFDMSLTDSACEGCKHRGSGEKYAEIIRSNGS